MTANILMIVTSSDRMGETDKPTGLWAEELAVPYYTLRDAGISVTLASTKGGQAPVDPESIQPVGENDPFVDRMLADDDLQRRVNSTVPLADLDMTRFDAVFFPGGHGTMWDLPNDNAVKNIVEQAFRDNKLIASVCHGAAGLVSALRADGLPVIHGRRINSFTDAEEREVGLACTVPFLLESRIRELGALFESADNWHPFAIQDGGFITGQNPQSSAAVANILIQHLTLSE